jgi:plastocyanin
MFTKSTRSWLALSVLLSLFALGSACNKNPTENGPTADNKPRAVYTPTGNEGTVTGKIAYAGTPPAPVKIDTSQDAVCGKKNPNLESEDNVVKDGKLANVFVYIKDGTTADGKKFSDVGWNVSSEPVTLDQDGCHYRPHVLGIQATQQMKITNSDPTQHNIHFTPQNNPEWNQSQANGAAAITHDFKVPETLVPVKCNQHPWMRAYVGVLRHPLFAVSKADGSFEIKGVPPGTYTVAAWHEGGAKGTEQTKQVTISAKGSATADFSFGSATASVQEPSLKMMPALEVPMVGRP